MPESSGISRLCISISNRSPMPIMYAHLFRFWQAIEALSPQGADKPDIFNKSAPIYRVEDEDDELPWLDQSHLRRPVPADKTWRYSLQCGLFNSTELAELLTQKLGAHDDVLNEKLKGGESRLFDLGFDDCGIPIPEMFVLSMACWASGQILKFGIPTLEQGGISNLNDIEEYDPPNLPPIDIGGSGYTGFDALSRRLISYVAKQAAVLQQEGKGATKEWLDQLVRFVAINCSLADTSIFSGFFNQPAYIAKCFQVKSERKTFPRKTPEGNGKPGEEAKEANENSAAQGDNLIGKPGDKAKDVAENNTVQGDDLINSFYIGDLSSLKEATKTNNLGKGLRDFLGNGERSRTDLRTPVGIRTALKMLSPERMPHGCWPSDYPLVFSQQLAVNEIWRRLAHKAELFAVNGPPGTGKTTLLRDIVAAVVVERAARLVEANDTFGQKQSQKIGDRVIPYYPFGKAVAGTSIVVVSANNGAVENVSLELPAITSVPTRVQGRYFKELATEVLKAQGQSSAEAWGLLAARLGNKQNRTTFLSKFWWAEPRDKGGQPWSGEGLRWHLIQIKNHNRAPLLSLDEAAKKFREAQRNEKAAREKLIKAAAIPECIRKEQAAYEGALRGLKKLEDERLELEWHANEMARHISSLDGAKAGLNKQIHALDECLAKHDAQKPRFLTWLFTFGRSHRDWRDRRKIIVTERDDLSKKLSALEKRARKVAADRKQVLAELGSFDRHIASECAKVEKLRGEIETLETELAGIKAALGAHWVDENWDDELREKSSPWMTEEWRRAREALFLAALDLHRAFIENNADKMITNLNLVSDWLSGKPLSELMARTALDTLCLVTPVISTTFASVPRMFADIGREEIGWLLIDEAGQALPQHAAGAIWRAKRTIVVGDPNQLEPVITVPFSVEGALAQYYNIEMRWWPTKTSVQRLADQAMDIGTLLSLPNASRDGSEDKLWVGCPLRVHRRCDEPMFSISNHIAYDGMMVFGKPLPSPSKLPLSCWIDVHGSSNQGHWVEEEGEVVKELVLLLKKLGITKEGLFLISPFRDCARKLSEIRKELHLDSKRVGTVHTSQGKEADVVILVLGGDPMRPGAKDWAASRPNLLNVAVSRAKKRLYVIGNAKEWGKRRFFNEAAKMLPRTTLQEVISQVQKNGSDEKAP